MFDGRLGVSLGLQLLEGSPVRLVSTHGDELPESEHRVLLEHDDLGVIALDVAFTAAEIRRNLLGRDFFRSFQIGFRESQSLLLVAREA